MNDVAELDCDLCHPIPQSAIVVAIDGVTTIGWTPLPCVMDGRRLVNILTLEMELCLRSTEVDLEESLPLSLFHLTLNPTDFISCHL